MNDDEMIWISNMIAEKVADLLKAYVNEGYPCWMKLKQAAAYSAMGEKRLKFKYFRHPEN